MITVAFATGIPLGSEIFPPNLFPASCAGSLTAASGVNKRNATAAIRNLVLRDRFRRSTDGFNMALNLLSKFVGRANASAADQLWLGFSSVRIKSSRLFAYLAASIPDRSTKSSQAYSLSLRSRAVAIHAKG